MRAMILAAGRGERMRPLTDDLPKPLLEVAGRSLLEWQIDRLARAGFRHLVVNVSHLAARIEAAIGDGARFGVAIRYSRETVALETAGGLASALPLLADRPFAAVNADVWTDFDYARLLPHLAAMEGAQKTGAHLVLVENPPHHPGGDFALDRNGRVRNGGPRLLTFSGIAAYHPALFSGLVTGQRAALGPLLRASADAGQLSGERYDGTWIDVGTPERLAALRARVAGA
ncbi:MAG: N-acetylmuramate alpha-1-phosphate uridylyltransferase MurU [Vicinamibacterales bacterium]